ncbi:MAG: prepilin peptidase [Steroidobacteraceae bacterium]|nr:prepilin peptidase [Steroidobacteraceae bacterium]MDW8259101.1 prepilin peptidase [Gammaproteobacteria bacterium]
MALLASSTPLLVAAVFALGLLVGSFLNVVIYREPIRLRREWAADCERLAGREPAPQPRFNLLTPRSACPACQAPITALQNIPVVSFVALKGRCARCGVRISWRYPAVELLTAALSALVAWRFGPTLACAAALIVTWFLIALSWIDYDTQYLPDSLTLPLLWLGLAASLLVGGLGPAGLGQPLPVAPRAAILGAMLGYLSLWSVYWLFKLLTGKEGMGYGDFKLLAALGAWLGAAALLPIVLLSALVGSIVGIVLIVARGRDRRLPIPFGPYLAAAGWLTMLFGNELAAAWTRLVLRG